MRPARVSARTGGAASPSGRGATAKRARKRAVAQPPGDLHKNHDIYFVPGLRRGLLMLEALASAGEPMSVAEIGKRIGLTRSSVFRLAYTLQHMGFVARVLNIGYAYLASQTLIETARPELESLRDRTSVSSHLAILDRGEILYLSCIQTKSGFLSTMNVGTRLPAYATPMGWLLLGDRSTRELGKLYPEGSFVALTDQTPRNLADLAQRIATAVSAGHAISHGAVEPGGSSIAAPIRDREGRIVAAIDVSAPDSAFDMAAFDRNVREVMESAARISSRLGFTPDAPAEATARRRSRKA